MAQACIESVLLGIGSHSLSLVVSWWRVCRLEQPEAVREDLVPALLAGVASHHAGCLPGWKALIEGLFQQGELPRLCVLCGNWELWTC